MSRESKFHNIIEQQDNKRKEQVWERVKDKIEINTQNETVYENGNSIVASPKRIFIPVISVAAVLLCAVVLILIFTLKPSTPDSGIRFCSESDYKISETDLTLKDYAQENGKELLFFDWYEETEEYSAQVTRLITTNEIICFTEMIIDIETGCPIKISVTDAKTQIDYLVPISTACNKTYQVNDTNIKWASSRYEGLATFEYKSFLYYITLTEPIEENAILDLVGILLGN